MRTYISKVASFAFALSLVFAAHAETESLAIASPKNGNVVTLLKPEQAAYLAMPRAERHAKLNDAAYRQMLDKVGSRPATVKLAWTDSAADSNAVYTVALKQLPDGREDRFAVTNATSVELVNFEIGRDYEWTVNGADGAKATGKFSTEATAPRLLLVPGVRNVRDLGGRKGLNGRRVKQGMIYRTAAYNSRSRKAPGSSFLQAKYEVGAITIAPGGVRELCGKLGVKTDLDLRTEVEVAGMNRSPLGQGVNWVHAPIRAYEFLENGRDMVAKSFRVFTDEKSYPVAFHCAGGRDRAGSLAFLLNAALGVDEDELWRDWEASVFATADLSVTSGRLDGLFKLLSTCKGDTINEKAVSFLKSCGISEAEIKTFRDIMLETPERNGATK